VSSWRIVHGDALRVLAEMPEASVDGVIADPPYSSGRRAMDGVGNFRDTDPSGAVPEGSLPDPRRPSRGL